jgi:hypothetical protein
MLLIVYNASKITVEPLGGKKKRNKNNYNASRQMIVEPKSKDVNRTRGNRVSNGFQYKTLVRVCARVARSPRNVVSRKT